MPWPFPVFFTSSRTGSRGGMMSGGLTAPSNHAPTTSSPERRMVQVRDVPASRQAPFQPRKPVDEAVRVTSAKAVEKSASQVASGKVEQLIGPPVTVPLHCVEVDDHLEMHRAVRRHDATQLRVDDHPALTGAGALRDAPTDERRSLNVVRRERYRVPRFDRVIAGFPAVLNRLAQRLCATRRHGHGRSVSGHDVVISGHTDRERRIRQEGRRDVRIGAGQMERARRLEVRRSTRNRHLVLLIVPAVEE